MKELLIRHWEQYPKMEAQDMVKLIFQSEFGGGHLISDPEKSLERFKREYENREWEGKESMGRGEPAGSEECGRGDRGTAGSKRDWRYVEPAGGGMCRIKLTALDLGLEAETLNRMFVRSAGEVHGTVQGMKAGLSELLELCGREIGLDRAMTAEYIRAYEDKGYPAVSHSEAYRANYHPAYRIVNAMYGQALPLFARIDRLRREAGDRTVNIAVDGMSGSGKSTLAKLLEGVYGCNTFHMDDFFLPPFKRTTERFREPGGNVDYERFKEQVIDHLGDESGVEYQVYDCSLQKLSRTVKTSGRGMNVVEGSYSQHPYFGDCYDLRIFLEIDGKEQVERIRRRNGEFMLRRFVGEWIPMENTYFSHCKIRENSQIVLTNQTQML